MMKKKLVISYLTKMKQELHTLSNGEEKDDLLSAFELLSQELSKDQPRTFLISSLLDYLGQTQRFISKRVTAEKHYFIDKEGII